MNIERDHLDAETVAAWIDGGLDAASLAAAEAHASNCNRCQTLLATVARTLPAEEHSGSQVAVAPHESPSSWWRWWFAPIAATAAAVTLWMVVPQDWMRAPASTAPQAEVAQAPPASPAPPTQPERAAAAAVEAPAISAAPPPVADARRAEMRRQTTGQDAEAKETLADAQLNRTDAIGSRDRLEKGEQPLRETVTVTGAPAAPAAPAEPAERAQLGAVTQLRKQGASLEFASPDGSHRWRLIPGAVEFSQDGGKSWVPATVSAGGSLVAGSAPLARVCWIVGRRGLVLLTTDGTNFTRLPFPEATDLAAVAATSAGTAIVTTVDGRTFRTDDRGQNWRNP